MLVATPTLCCEAFNGCGIDDCGVLVIGSSVEEFVDVFSEDRRDGVNGFMPR